MSNKHMGSRFDDFLEGEGMLEEVTDVALRRVIAQELKAKPAATRSRSTAKPSPSATRAGDAATTPSKRSAIPRRGA